MNISVNGFSLEFKIILRTEKEEREITLIETELHHFKYSDNATDISFVLNDDFTYSIDLKSDIPSSLKLSISLLGSENLYHLIPCNIHGDNNLSNAKPGFFPNLTNEYPESDTTSPEWEFRADRASHPVSIITCDKGAAGISIKPYSDDASAEDGFIRNGVFSKLPAEAGVSLGYTNYPHTFTFKEMMTESTNHKTLNACANGKIYAVPGDGRLTSSEIVRDIYYRFRECPAPLHSTEKYLEAYLDSYENINWSEEMEAFTNEECRPPDSPELRPWRPLIATGWTGTGILIYPLLSAQLLTGAKNSFTDKMRHMFDMMSERINPATGLFYDLIRPWNDSDVNGWWAGYMVKDCHCAYTNGNGIYYLLKTYNLLLKETGEDNRKWLDPALSALDSIIKIQRADGCYGYTFSLEEPKILDPDGFAGCWFAAACALAYRITGKPSYLKSAEKGIAYYYEYVKNLDCWGTPMDTWKSNDQEGNLGFLKAAVQLHKATGSQLYLKMAVHSAEYEYLWRYSFKARPEFRPLKNSGWNSCGGSVTSVSNPHIHPMGVNITAELLYVYKNTDDIYHLHRAQDGLNWGLATSDLYPDITGYGRLGVVTERYCPSDGLTTESYSDTVEPSSIWFTFNGWAGASILEGLTETLLENKSIKSSLGKSAGDLINNLKTEVT